MSVQRAVVVGASAAGLAAADGLRDGGWTGDVTVLSAELHGPYERPMLSKSLLSTQECAEPLALRTPKHLARNRIDLQLGQEAMGLDIDRRLIVTNNGDAVPYDVLVIATGSRPRQIVTTSGEILPVLRDLNDLARLRRLTAAHTPVTLIGAGLLGLEVAAALRARDIPVTVFGSEQIPVSSCVGDTVGRWLYDLHRDHGVRLHTGVKVVAVSGGHGDYRIDLDDGTRHRAEVILAGVGIEPADGWLKGSGVTLGDGVHCDQSGRTSVANVWAAGDVASVADADTGRRRRFEHWTNAIWQGRQVGLNIARSAADPTPRLCSLWTKQYGHTLRVLGSREPDDIDVPIEGAVHSGVFIVAHTRRGKVHAITSCGLDRSLRAYSTLLENCAPLEQF